MCKLLVILLWYIHEVPIYNHWKSTKFSLKKQKFKRALHDVCKPFKNGNIIFAYFMKNYKINIYVIVPNNVLL
jgi:hypothetical protein